VPCRLRIRDRPSFLGGVTLVALGLLTLMVRGGGHDPALAWIFVGGGALRVVMSFFFRWRLGAGVDGPGPLTPSPTGRFRASGWPPSKDPEAYR
jgi:hypothetical protein